MARKKTILVTGGAGYIGSHTVKALQDNGYRVVVIDNLVCGNAKIIEEDLQAKLIVGDINDRSLLAQIFAIFPISAVIHLAANNLKGRLSNNSPQYYWDNVTGTLSLLKAMISASVKKIVFTSAGEIYGTPAEIPISESASASPNNMYGNSKLIIEKILADFGAIYGLNSVVFRYFNVAGVDRGLRKIQLQDNHLISSILMASLYQRDSLAMLHTNYPTADGTYIRDYVHVSDVAQAHVLGLEYLLAAETREVFNLGSDRGFSAKEIIDTTNRVTGKKIKIQHCDREEIRFAGRKTLEPAILLNSSDKAKIFLGWQPQQEDLLEMVSQTWKCYLKSYNLQQLVDLVAKKQELRILTA